MATEEKYIALDYQGRRFSKPKKVQLTKPIAALSPNDMAAKQKKENKWGASLIPIQNFTGEKPKIPNCSVLDPEKLFDAPYDILSAYNFPRISIFFKIDVFWPF